MKINHPMARKQTIAPAFTLMKRAPAMLAVILGLTNSAAPSPTPLRQTGSATANASGRTITSARTAIAQPASSARPSVAPRPVSPSTAVGSWRDAAQTPGTWNYAAEKGGTAARFSTLDAMPLLVLRCDLARRMVIILRPTVSDGPVATLINTNNGTRNFMAKPAVNVEPKALAIEFDPRDAVLDQMAFSRGRFALEMGRLPILILPAWAEVGRVIEDCR